MAKIHFYKHKWAYSNKLYIYIYIADFGRVLLGENGEWICGLSKGLGSCAVYIA